MGSEFNKTVRDFANSLKNATPNKTSPYDTPAIVRRVDGNTAWVHIEGGVDETPVRLTTNAKRGDIVQVRIAGGTAWLTGNATAPPTDDTMANEANKRAAVADEHAADAVASASLAQKYSEIARSEAASASSAATRAWEKADDAETAAGLASDAAAAADGHATAAAESADDAQEMAESATRSANDALRELGIVNDVVDTLNWVQKHGYYQITEDDSVVANKVYYSITGIAITNPTGRPNLNLYYERTSVTVNEETIYLYSLSSDISVDSQKTYYSVISSTISNPTGNPSANYYYELAFNEALAGYVSTHLSLTDAGLYLFNDSNSGRVLVSTDGVEIRNAQNNVVGKYGSGAVIGNINAQHISIENGQINFWAGTELDQTNLVAYVSGQELHIPRVVVVQSLQMGDWRWDATMENHLSLNWIGG